MNPRKEAAYRMLSLIAAVIFVLPCVCLVFPTFDIHLDNLWQMDSLMAFICAYKNTLILAIAGVLIQLAADVGQGHAGVAAGGLHNHRAGLEQAPLLGVQNHVKACPVRAWFQICIPAGTRA